MKMKKPDIVNTVNTASIASADREAVLHKRAVLQEIIQNKGCRGREEGTCDLCPFKHEGDSGCLLAYPYIGGQWPKETAETVKTYCYVYCINSVTGADGRNFIIKETVKTEVPEKDRITEGAVRITEDAVRMSGQGMKFDQGKPDWSLVDLSVIEEWLVCRQEMHTHAVPVPPYELYMSSLKDWQKGEIETPSGQPVMALAAAAYMRSVCHVPFTEKEDIQEDIQDAVWLGFPLSSLEDMVKVLTHGAVKYARDNWQKVPDARNRYFAALFRHNLSVMNGDMLDPEFGLPHTAHALCNLYFLTWFNMQDILAGKNKKEMQ